MTEKVLTRMVNPFWDEAAPLLTLPNDDDDLRSFEGIGRRVEAEMCQWEARKTFCTKYTWAIPDPDSVFFVAHHLGSHAIEIGAGTGYWASLLVQCGVDMLAFDEAPPDLVLNDYFGVYDTELHGLRQELIKVWYPVLQDGPEVLAEHADRALFLCWPPYAGPMAHRCLQCYQGRRLVFIGEGQGGCTGDDAFFEELGKHWEEVAEHHIVQWFGINDYITVYERKQ